jgi:hypothetical protein
MVAKSADGAARCVVLYDRLIRALGRLPEGTTNAIGERWWAWYYRQCGY